MVQTRDIFLRALAVAPDKEKRKGTYRPSTPAADDSKWSKVVLIFDTESRITADQSLTFGVYRLCERVHDNYRLVEEGLFYAGDLPPKERTELKNYVRTAVSDVASFPPRFPLYSRSDAGQNLTLQSFSLLARTRAPPSDPKPKPKPKPNQKPNHVPHARANHIAPIRALARAPRILTRSHAPRAPRAQAVKVKIKTKLVLTSEYWEPFCRQLTEPPSMFDLSPRPA
jgi:hypothetical protein